MTPDLFDSPTYTLTVDPAVLEPVGLTEGGWPSFLADLKSRLQGTTLTLSDTECQRVYRYAQGSGGMQSRFKAIVSAAWAAGWVQP